MRHLGCGVRLGRILALCASVIVLCVPSGGWAHGGVGMDIDPCVERVGPYLVHFSAYQFQDYATEEFCRRVPKTGDAVLVIDLIDPQLRNKPAALRIVQAPDSTAPRVLLDIPPKLYPNGVVNAAVTFEAPGTYAALMTVDGVDGAVRFPIRVAAFSNLLLFLIAGILAGCGVGYAVVYGKRAWLRPRKAASATSVRVSLG